MQPQSNQSYYFTQISNDLDLMSLFNQCEDIQYKEDQKQMGMEMDEIQINPKDLAKGYSSDYEAKATKNKNISKQKQIINKKDKIKTKKRTRMYIEMLENKVIDLQNQIERLKKLNKKNIEYIHRLQQPQHVINGYFVGRQQVIQKLQMLNEQKRVDSQKIKQEIISLRLRQGVYGKDRIKSVNYYFKQMVEMILPEIQKYLIKTAVQNSDFFDVNYLRNGIPSQQLQDWRKAFLEHMGAEMKQKAAKQYLYNNRQNIIQEAAKFKQILLQFCNTKSKLQQQAKKLQEVFDGAHKYMKPVQVSKSLCYIDKYRFEKNISLEKTFCQVFKQLEKKVFSYDIERPFCI